MIKPRKEFITDTSGKKKAVIIPYREYEELMEDLYDLKLIADRKDEDVISLKEFKRELKRNGRL